MTKKQIYGISIGGAIVIVLIIVCVVIFGGNKDKPVNGTENTTSESFETDDSSSENDVDDKDNADEFPDGDSDSETTVNPDEDDKDSEDTTTPVNPDDGETSDSEDDTTDPDDGDDKDSEDDTTEPTNPDDDDKEPVHTCNYNTVKNDSSNHWYVCSCGKTANKSAHNYSNDSDTTCNTCGYTRTVATEPEKPSTIPSVSWTGGDITLGSLGISIPTLKDFNDEALGGNASDGYGWAGAVSTDAEQTLANTLNSVRDALVNSGCLNNRTGQGFAVENYSISFDWASYSAVNL